MLDITAKNRIKTILAFLDISGATPGMRRKAIYFFVFYFSGRSNKHSISCFFTRELLQEVTEYSSDDLLSDFSADSAYGAVHGFFKDALFFSAGRFFC